MEENKNMPPTSYWIVKGNKNFPNELDERYGDLKEIVRYCLTKGVDSSGWLSKKKLPYGCRAGDRVFFWSSSPDRYVMAVGEMIRVGDYHPGEHRFDVRFIDVLDDYIGIEEIRSAYAERLKCTTMPDFLRPAIVATVYGLKQREAEILADLIKQKSGNRNRTRLIETLGQWFPVPVRSPMHPSI